MSDGQPDAALVHADAVVDAAGSDTTDAAPPVEKVEEEREEQSNLAAEAQPLPEGDPSAEQHRQQSQGEEPTVQNEGVPANADPIAAPTAAPATEATKHGETDAQPTTEKAKKQTQQKQAAEGTSNRHETSQPRKEGRTTANNMVLLRPVDHDELKLLYLPPNARSGITEEHERHRERLEAIHSGRSVSQTTVMSRSSNGRMPQSPRQRPVDPVTQKMALNHWKALEKIMAPGPSKMPLVHITHCTRWGNTHAAAEEFVDPRHPNEPLSARDKRLRHNSYRNGRLAAAERVDNENAKLVGALINAKPVVQSTFSLLNQERERQETLRRIERGPRLWGRNAKTSPRDTDAAETTQRESQWNNQVSNFIPRPPLGGGSVISGQDSARPRVLWDEKLEQARELERRKLASMAVSANEGTAPTSEDVAAGEPAASKAQSSPTRRPKPPSESLVACMEKVPHVKSGRHPGKGPQQSTAKNARGERAAAPSEVAAPEPNDESCENASGAPTQSAAELSKEEEL